MNVWWLLRLYHVVELFFFDPVMGRKLASTSFYFAERLNQPVQYWLELPLALSFCHTGTRLAASSDAICEAAFDRLIEAGRAEEGASQARIRRMVAFRRDEQIVLTCGPNGTEPIDESPDESLVALYKRPHADGLLNLSTTFMDYPPGYRGLMAAFAKFLKHPERRLDGNAELCKSLGPLLRGAGLSIAMYLVAAMILVDRRTTEPASAVYHEDMVKYFPHIVAWCESRVRMKMGEATAVPADPRPR